MIFLARAGTGFTRDFLEEREGVAVGGRIVLLAGVIFPEDFGFFMEIYKPK